MRSERAHPALQLLRGPRGVEPPVVGADLLGVGHALVGLLAPRRRIVERLHEQLAAEHGQPGGERAVVVVGVDRLAALEADRARVQLGGRVA